MLSSHFRILALAAATSLLASCGAGSHSALPQTPASQTPSSPSTYTGPIGNATFTIKIPAPSGTNVRRPDYVSSATKSVKFTLTAASALTAGQITGVNGTGDNTFNVTPGSGACPGTAPWTCTFSVKIPAGIDSVQATTYDAIGATGNVLSQQILSSLTIAAGSINGPFNFTFDANANTMAVSGTGQCTSGLVGASFGTVGTSPVTFTVAYTDADMNTIVGPGLPKIEIKDSSGTYQSASGTINGAGGTVSFAINQSAQTFTLTASNSSVTGATINVQAVPANAADGLGFSKTQIFTFATGAAPPPSFLAAIEQLGTSSGKIDLFTINVGGTSGSPDSFVPYTVSGGGTSLSVTNSTNEGKPDVDNPRDIQFDSTGNLLIANGGQGGAGGDYGDFACVPAGAIATGSTTTTTNSTNAYDPESLAIGTDSSVSIANVPAGAAYNLVNYTLGTSYVHNPTGDIVNAGTLGATSVISLPSLANGTFGVAITDGTSISRVTLKYANGSTYNITDADISSPESLGWDAHNSQMVIATHNIQTVGVNNYNASKLVFYSVSGTPTKYSSMSVRPDPNVPGYSYMLGDKVAVSPSGYIAVAGGTADGPEEVQIYDNTLSRNAIGGPLPFDAYTNSACTTGYFGTVTVVYAMRWISDSKLLIALRANGTGKQGVYIYDRSALVSVPGGLYRYDGNAGTCNAVTGTIPKQTGFQSTTNPPLGLAYKA